jgi:queuine/archaeosine tRNA-ribosyltransferase
MSEMRQAIEADRFEDYRSEFAVRRARGTA